MNQKGQALILVLATILIIATIAYGAYFLGKSTTSKPSPILVSQTPQPTPNASREPNGVGEITNWKTYSGTVKIQPKIRFTFKYPPNLLVITNPRDEDSGKDSQNPITDASYFFKKEEAVQAFLQCVKLGNIPAEPYPHIPRDYEGGCNVIGKVLLNVSVFTLKKGDHGYYGLEPSNNDTTYDGKGHLWRVSKELIHGFGSYFAAEYEADGILYNFQVAFVNEELTKQYLGIYSSSQLYSFAKQIFSTFQFLP